MHKAGRWNLYGCTYELRGGMANMKKYETPFYEVEYFTIKNDIFTTSENPDIEFGDPGMEDGPEIF